MRKSVLIATANFLPLIKKKGKIYMESFIAYLISGISLGSIYALIALGYTMVYGIAKMLNFAHGDVIMVGGFVVYMAVTEHSLPAAVGILIAVLVCTMLGVAIEKIAYKPLRQASSLSVLITAIGVSYFLQNTMLIWKGSGAKNFKSVVTLGTIHITDSLKISGEAVVTILVTIVIMVVLTLFVNYTKTGMAMKAVSEDKGAAELMGINVNRTISIVFAIGSALAAVAGILLCSTFTQVSPYTGTMPGIKAFIAAVFGGIGSIPGAMIGGILLGVIENLSKAYISTQLADAIVFASLILVLMLKPTGILGKRINEKV